MSAPFTISYSANYGDTPKKLMEDVIIPFLDELKKNKDQSIGLRIVGRQGKITGIHREFDEGWDGFSERRQKPR